MFEEMERPWEEGSRQWWNYEGSEQQVKDLELNRQNFAGYTTLFDLEKTIAAQKRGQKKGGKSRFEAYQKGIDKWEKKAVKARREVAELESIYGNNKFNNL